MRIGRGLLQYFQEDLLRDFISFSEGPIAGGDTDAADTVGPVTAARRSAMKSAPILQTDDAETTDGAPGPRLFATVVLAGGAEDDTLVGGAEDDTLTGGVGDDDLKGVNGDDQLIGGGGNDKLNGGGGNDKLIGGGGKDKLIGGGGKDLLKGGGGNDKLIGGGGNDKLIGGGGKDKLIGGGGKDLLKGGGGSDVLKGGGGKDKLIGGGGKDTLKGGGGDDLLKGGGGNDLIEGGGGDDTLTGNKGADTFAFKSKDLSGAVKTITDFESGTDRIDLFKVAGVGNFNSLDLTAAGGGVDIAVGGGRIRLEGVSVNELDAFDFVLPSAAGSTPPSDPFTGGSGPDVLTSGPGDDLIQGFGGDDKLGAGAGFDTLVGGTGADIFVARLVNGAIEPTLDIVRDFSYVSGDRVGLTEVLSGVNFTRLDEVVRATPTGGDTLISVKRGATFQNIFRLEDVTFNTEDLISYGFTAPPANSTVFIDNPYGFANNSFATADPAATRDGVHIAWVDRQNLDNNPVDRDPADNENASTRDVFIMNTTTGAIQRVSEKGPGDQFLEAVSPALSADGRHIAYAMERTSSSEGDVFVRDMAFPDSAPIQVNIATDGSIGGAGTPILNVNRGGLAGSISNESVSVVDISGDGNRVVFVTRSQLTGTDTNSNNDVYLRDIAAGTTTLITQIGGVATGGVGSTTDVVRISENGRYVAFSSNVALTPGEQDGGQFSSGANDIYLFDTQTGQYLLVSSIIAGGATGFDMSADGSRIVFATNEDIAGDDDNELSDIYVANINLSSFTVTSRQRVSEADGQFQVMDDDSYAPTISHDGDTIAFLSQANDLTNFTGDVDVSSGNGDVDERLYVLDLDTGVLKVAANPNAVAARESLTTHAALTDDGVVHRVETDADPGGSRSISDAIGFSAPVAPTVVEVGSSTGTAGEIGRFTSFRSTIDSASDHDIFFIKGSSSSTRDFSVSIEGIDTNAGTLGDPKVTVRRQTADGDIVNSLDGGLAIDDNGGVGRNAFVRVDVTNSTNLFIEVESANGSTGSYRITINEDDTPLGGADFLF